MNMRNQKKKSSLKVKSFPAKIKKKIYEFLWRCTNIRPEGKEYHWSQIPNDIEHGFLWRSTNIRPKGKEYHWSKIPNDIEERIYNIATQESAEYVLKHMPDISGTISLPFIRQYCTELASKDGLFLEFGVSKGFSINQIATFTQNTVHGFDSFQGLPEDWGPCKKGAFSREGQLPKVRDNVKLHVGLFDVTLPEFLKEYQDKVSLLHIDSDLYSSAKTVLDLLSHRIIPGTIIIFDEYFNYPGWQRHEYLAFQEFVQAHNVKYKYIAYCSRGYTVAVLIENIQGFS